MIIIGLFSVGKEWQKGLSLPSKISESDYAISHTLSNRLKAASAPSSSFNITLNLDTNQVRGFLFKARAKLTWPQIAPANLHRLNFFLTQVGNYSFKEVTFSNPSEEIVYAHLVPLSAYPQGHDLISTLPALVSANKDLNDISVPFSNDSCYKFVSVISGEDPLQSPGHYHDVTLHPDTKAFILQPKSTAKVKIRFAPESVGYYRSGLFLRNNLTGIEFLQLFGEAVHGEIKFSKYKATPMTMQEEASNVLEFDMKDKHLKCHSNQSQQQKLKEGGPLYSVTRPFKVKNLGMTSFYVKGFYIEDFPCEGFGFRVINCEPFSLEPSETKDIYIAFTPDFTLSRISRKLSLKTTIKHLESLNYTLTASVPSHLLATCAATLPRPSWEPYLYWILNVAMGLVAVGVVFVATLEADRIYDMAKYLLDNEGYTLDFRKMTESLQGDLNLPSSSGPRTLQEIRSGLRSVKPPIFGRIFTCVRGFLRGFGIRVWNLFWLVPLPNFGALLRPPKIEKDLNVNHEAQEDQEADDEDDEDDKYESKDKSAPHSALASASSNAQEQKSALNQGSGSQSIRQKQSKNSKKLSRKKSLPTDMDEASSTTTESSAFDDFNDTLKSNESTKGQNGKKNKANNNSKQPEGTLLSSNVTTSSKKPKAKKQNSVEGKKASPERPSQDTSKATVAQTNKKATPAPAPNREPNRDPIPAQHLPVSEHQPQKMEKKVTPVGKILPEIKKPENHGALYGPVGAKPMKPSWNHNSPNNIRNDLNDTHHHATNGFGNPPGGPPQLAPNNMNSLANNTNNEDMRNASNSNSPSRSAGASGPSFMTQLQLNRRQETAQFLAGISQWPGFNEPAPTSAGLQEPSNFLMNLWDNPESHNLRSSAGGSPSQDNIWGGSNGLWGDNSGPASLAGRNGPPQPASNHYIGGLSVSRQQDIFRQQRPEQRPPPPPPPAPAAVAATEGSPSFSGFNPLGLQTIWTQQQQRRDPQSCDPDNQELNQFQQPPSRVLQPQQQPQPQNDQNWVKFLFNKQQN